MWSQHWGGYRLVRMMKTRVPELVVRPACWTRVSASPLLVFGLHWLGLAPLRLMDWIHYRHRLLPPCCCIRATTLVSPCSIQILVKAPFACAHGNPHAESNKSTSCRSGAGSRPIDQTEKAGNFVTGIAASSVSTPPTNEPLNHRGWFLTVALTLDTLAMTNSENWTVGGGYSQLPTISRAVMRSSLM